MEQSKGVASGALGRSRLRRRLDVREELCPKGHVFVARGEQRSRRTCKQCFNEYQREYLKGYRARKRQEAQEREAS